MLSSPKTPPNPQTTPVENTRFFAVDKKNHAERTDKSSPPRHCEEAKPTRQSIPPAELQPSQDGLLRCARNDGLAETHGCARRSPQAKTGWSPERRAKQSAMMRERKIWTRSTGPKTAEGKQTSSLNAYKHGLNSRSVKNLRQVLRDHSHFLDDLNRTITMAKRQRKAAKLSVTQNELLEFPFSKAPRQSSQNSRRHPGEDRDLVRLGKDPGLRRDDGNIKILCETSVPSAPSVVNPFSDQKTISFACRSLYPPRISGFTESIKVRFFPVILTILLFSFAFMPDAKAQADFSVNSLRIGTYPDKTRIVIDVSSKADFRAFMLEKPSRLVIDLPTFAWQAIPTKPPAGSLVSTIRNGALEPGISRIVIDVEKPVTLKSAFFLPAGPGISDRVVIDFAPVSAGYSFAQERMFGSLSSKGGQLGIHQAMKAPVKGARETETAYTLKVPDSQPSRGNEESAAPAKSAKGRKPLIVIDPGHGGQDPGALGANGTQEKSVTLATAQELKRQLEATGRYRVHLTRSTDIFIKLQDRVAIGRDKGADLFISLHADSIDKPGVSGASIYTLSNKASDAQTAKLAARENRADLIAGVDLSHEDKQVANILIDLAMRDTMNQSKFFANTVVKNAKRQGIQMLEQPHRFAGFAVLKAPDVPSVLIEMGFMSNKREVSQLSSPAYREKIAGSVLAGIDAYFSKVQKNGQN